MMRILWAPWRIKYILSSKKPTECIFCTKPRENRDEENLILYRGKLNFVMLNLYPYNNGHLLIAPYRHVPSLEDMTLEELTEMMALARACLRLLREVMKPDGFNLGFNIGKIAGAGFEGHIHLHIVPRWAGDTNFMPVVAETKVIPEAPSDTYRRLKARIEVLEEELRRLQMLDRIAK